MEPKPISTADLERAWHGQRVFVPDGMSPHVKPGEYIVTAAFWETDAEIVFALMAADYSVDNPNWVAFHLNYLDWIKLTKQLERLGSKGDFMSRMLAFKAECERRTNR